jgi:hypothetical protein
MAKTAVQVPQDSDDNPTNWQVRQVVRKDRQVPPPDWATELVQTSYDSNQWLGRLFGSDKTAKAGLHQLRRAAQLLGKGLCVQLDGADLSVLAKDRKVVTKKPTPTS